MNSARPGEARYVGELVDRWASRRSAHAWRRPERRGRPRRPLALDAGLGRARSAARPRSTRRGRRARPWAGTAAGERRGRAALCARARSRHYAWRRMTLAACRFCGGPLVDTFLRPRPPAAGEYLRDRRAARRGDRAGVSAARPRLRRAASWSRLDEVGPPGYLPTTPISRRSLPPGSRMRRAYAATRCGGFGSGRSPRRRGREQRRLPAAHFVAAGIPCLGVEPAANVAAAAVAAGVPTRCRSSARRRTASSPSGRPRGPGRGQQRVRPRARRQRLRRRLARLAAARRRRDRAAASAAPDRGPAVRHDLP